MNIGTANYVITIQIQNSNIPFKYQVNLPWNTLVGLPPMNISIYHLKAE